MSDFGTKRNTSGAIFFSVRKSTDDKGRPCAVLAAKAQKGDPGAKPVYKKDGSQAVDKDGNDLWQTEHDYLTGRIIALEDKAVTMAGKDRHFLNVTVMGKTTKMVLSLERGDNYWVDFLKRLLNVDLQKPVEFQPYSIADKEKPGKVNRLMMLRQDGVNIPSMWNKANNYGHDENGEGGIPSGEQFENPKTGEMDWSFLKRDRWLDEKVAKHVASELEAMHTTGDFNAPPPEADEDPVSQLDQAFGGVDSEDPPY